MTLSARLPQRIRMHRTKGWRKPVGAVYVGRPSRWGNPYRVGTEESAAECVAKFERWCRQRQTDAPAAFAQWLAPLSGHDLACWCAPDTPCHANVLLRLANEPWAPFTPKRPNHDMLCPPVKAGRGGAAVSRLSLGAELA